MAINFEAANMAGYNNPRIEVFKATVDPETFKVTGAPGKTEIIRCLRRGSIPAILQTSPDGSESNLLWLNAGLTGGEGVQIIFGNSTSVIIYPPDSDSPIAGNGG